MVRVNITTSFLIFQKSVSCRRQAVKVNANPRLAPDNQPVSNHESELLVELVASVAINLESFQDLHFLIVRLHQHQCVAGLL